MDAEDIVLGIVAAAGGKIEGRTYLQKVAYFVAEIMAIPMGFGPHYYGPYSSTITAESNSQVAMGRLREDPTSFGSGYVRYNYGLTEEGKEYLKAIEFFDPDGFQGVREIVVKITSTGADYRQLSCAAKLYYLLGKAGDKISRQEAKEQGGQLGWKMSDADIDAAIKVLQQLDLVH